MKSLLFYVLPHEQVRRGSIYPENSVQVLVRG